MWVGKEANFNKLFIENDSLVFDESKKKKWQHG